MKKLRLVALFFIATLILLGTGCSQAGMNNGTESDSFADPGNTIPAEDLELMQSIEQKIREEFPLESTITSSVRGYGVNPSHDEILAFMKSISAKYCVPHEVLFAIGDSESDLMQFYSTGQPVISGDDGIGIMQVTPWAVGEAFDRDSLMWDWRYNVEAGAQVVLGKWQYVKSRNPIGNMDWQILENWYLAIWAYNGYSYINNPNEYIYGARTWSNGYVSWTIAYPYQTKILKSIKEHFTITVTPIPSSLLPGYGARPGIPYSGQTFSTPQPAHSTGTAVPMEFTQIGGALADIGIGGGTVWGVNSADYIYYKNGSSWINVAGRLSAITADDTGKAWGVNSGQKIYRWSGSSWINIPGYLVDIGAKNGMVWGVNSAGNVYKYLGNNNWLYKPASFIAVRIDVDDDGDPWVIASDGTIHAFNYSGEWIQISGILKDIGYGGGKAWGVNSAGNIYRYEGYGKWTQFPASFAGHRIDVDDNGIAWVLSTDGRIFQFTPEN